MKKLKMESWQHSFTTGQEAVGRLLSDSQRRSGICGRYLIILLSGLPQVPCRRQDLSVDLRALHALGIRCSSSFNHVTSKLRLFVLPQIPDQ